MNDNLPGEPFVVVTRARSEHFAADELTDLGFATYVPTIDRWRGEGPRRHKERQAILSRYFFVWSNDITRDFDAIRHSRRVTAILGIDGRPYPVPTPWLAGLMMSQVFGRFDFTAAKKPKMTIGQSVKIVGGCFKGLKGKLVELGDKRSTVMIEGKGAITGKMGIETDKLEAAA